MTSADTDRNNDRLLRAAAEGNVAEVRRLIPLSNPLDRDSAALGAAAQNGHAECVTLLLPVSDPTKRDNQPLRWAAGEGHAECVTLLLEGASRKAIRIAFQTAVLWGHMECVELMYGLCNTQKALYTLQSVSQQNPENGLYIRAVERLQQVMAEKQKEVLLSAVDCGGVTKHRKL